MTVQELIDRINRIVPDPSFTPEIILSYLNQGLQRVANGVMIEWPGDSTRVLSNPLPDLLTTYDFTTTTDPYVPLPPDFSREITAVINVTRKIPLQYFDSWGEFRSFYPLLNRVSSVITITRKGNQIYYQGIPAEPETIEFDYYRNPAKLIKPTDEPEGIPPEFHAPVLENYAARELWSLKEQGIDGQSFNTKKHDDLFMEAMVDMDKLIGAEQIPVRFEMTDD